jgi:XisH protein
MARDKYHQEVKRALEKDGWTITADPLYLKIGRFPIHIDLGAEKVFGAEKNGEKIAVEVKTFGLFSFITAFYEAVGKYLVYREALVEMNSPRVLYLAIPNTIYDEYCAEILIQRIFTTHAFKIIVYDSITETVVSWLK